MSSALQDRVQQTIQESFQRLHIGPQGTPPETSHDPGTDGDVEMDGDHKLVSHYRKNKARPSDYNHFLVSDIPLIV